MIEARSLTKTFRDRKRGEFRAVDGVSFRVEPGQVYGLLGANGAGKTTTLRMLATLLRPTAGSAAVAGFDTTTSAARARARTGFLASGTALYGRLTARETIGYFGKLHGMDDATIATRIDRLAGDLGLGEFLDRRCESLSTGMKQKISLARMLVHDPAVLIFDEPTLGLDVMAARAVVRLVREFGASGKTVIYSTHIMNEIEKLCDRVGIIHGGRLLAEDTLAGLKARTGAADLEDAFVKIVGEPEAA